MKITLSPDDVAKMVAEHFKAKGQRVNRVLFCMQATPQTFDPTAETSSTKVEVTHVEVTVDPLPKRRKR
jgi:hypothetical protein